MLEHVWFVYWLLFRKAGDIHPPRELIGMPLEPGLSLHACSVLPEETRENCLLSESEFPGASNVS